MRCEYLNLHLHCLKSLSYKLKALKKLKKQNLL